jgi:transcriptional regulator with XRE-family HTH domain
MRLTVERNRLGWSRSKLAREADLNQATVGAIEARRLIPYDSQLRKIAAALGWPEEDAAALLESADDREGIPLLADCEPRSDPGRVAHKAWVTEEEEARRSHPARLKRRTTLRDNDSHEAREQTLHREMGRFLDIVFEGLEGDIRFVGSHTDLETLEVRAPVSERVECVRTILGSSAWQRRQIGVEPKTLVPHSEDPLQGRVVWARILPFSRTLGDERDPCSSTDYTWTKANLESLPLPPTLIVDAYDAIFVGLQLAELVIFQHEGAREWWNQAQDGLCRLVTASGPTESTLLPLPGAARPADPPRHNETVTVRLDSLVAGRAYPREQIDSVLARPVHGPANPWQLRLFPPAPTE